MDRIAYLSALPFLIPLQSKSWPPQPSSSSSSSSVSSLSSNCQVLLGQQHQKIRGGIYSNSAASKFVVSIELLPRAEHGSNDNHTNRIMYFAKPQSSSSLNNNNLITNTSTINDPALTTIEIAVITTSSTSSTGSATDDTSGSSTVRTTNTTGNSGAPAVSTPHEQVYIRFQEDHVFVFHVSPMCNSCRSSSSSNNRIDYIPSTSKKSLVVQNNVVVNPLASTSAAMKATTTTNTTNNTTTSGHKEEDDDNVGRGYIVQPQCVILQLIDSNVQFRIFAHSPMMKYHSQQHHTPTNLDLEEDEQEEIKIILQQVVAVFDRMFTAQRGTIDTTTTTTLYHPSPNLPTYKEIAKDYRLPIVTTCVDDPNHSDMEYNSSSSAGNSHQETAVHQNQQQLYEEDKEAKQVVDTRTGDGCTTTTTTTKETIRPGTSTDIIQENKQTDTTIVAHQQDSSCTGKSNSSSLLQQYLLVQNQSLSSIDTIRQILHLPISSLTSPLNPNDDNNKNSIAQSDRNGLGKTGERMDDEEEVPIVRYNSILQSLLNATGKHMAQSYIIGSESDKSRTDMDDYYNTMIHHHKQQQIDPVLNTYFSIPSSSSSSHPQHRQYKRRKLQQQQLLHSSTKSVNSTTATTNNTMNVESTTTEAIPDTVTALMAEQKRLIQERYQLFLLPSRG